LFIQDPRLSSERQYQTSLIQEKVEYEECIKEQSKNIYKIDGYSVQFFGICNSVFSRMCDENNPFCGTRTNRNQECKKNTDCNVMVTIKNQDNNVVLKGVSGNRNLEPKPSNPNKEIFGDVVMLVDTHKDLPYLILKDTIFGSWGVGYWYHLYSTKNGFRKVTDIGPIYGGLYQNKDGDYLVDLRDEYHPPEGVGSLSVKIADKLPYKLINGSFIIDHETIRSNLIKFTQEDINQYLERSVNIRKYIIDLFNSEEDQWILDNPFRLFVYPQYEGYGYPFYDMFKLTRNGRKDVARQYFDTMIPDEYNKNSHLFEEHVNTKDKLWNKLNKSLFKISIRKHEASD
jgi:hypothetical protein